MNRGKRLLSLLLTVCMVLGLLPATALAASNTPFADVSALDWYCEAVEYVYEKGMMSGTGETTFSPDDATTRGMIVTILHQMEGKPAPAAQAAFSDVTAEKYYANAVAWANEQDIVAGYENGAFQPETPITREQMAAILYRYVSWKGLDVSAGEDTNILSYADAFSISEYAIPALQWACGAGLIQGMGDGALNPGGTATRAQVATILMRLCQWMESGSGQSSDETASAVLPPAAAPAALNLIWSRPGRSLPP